MSDYDVIVLGGGPAGEHCCGALADGGLRVALVERELVAGECSYWACIPSKTLLRPGEALAAAREAPGAAAIVGEALVDPAGAFAWRDFQVSGYSDAGQVAWLESKGIDLLRGAGRLAGRAAAPNGGRPELHAVEVGDRVITAPHVVLATGSDPVVPPIPGLRGLEGVWTNREATGLTEVPRRLLVLGGGPVGVELAQAIRRMGAEVALVEGAEHVLPREPRAVGEAIGEALIADGVELRLGEHATAARRDGVDFVLEFADGSELRGDRLLVATGRRPRSAGLGLEAIGVEPARNGAVPVDDRMAVATADGPLRDDGRPLRDDGRPLRDHSRTAVVDGLWAVGDVTGVWPLTYVGKYQARVAAANILGREARASYDAVPRVVFTDPQAAAVGEPDGPLAATIPLSEVPRTSTFTRAYDTKPGFLTLVSDGKVLTGASAVGPEAGEWLQQATLAIRARIPLAVLRDTIQPFPTFSEGFLFAVLELTAAGVRPLSAAE